MKSNNIERSSLAYLEEKIRSKCSCIHSYTAPLFANFLSNLASKLNVLIGAAFRVRGLMGVCMGTVLLSGCSHHQPTYTPDDFINPNRVEEKVVRLPDIPQQVKATFGYGNNPQVVKAYEQFTENGKAETVFAEGFITLPYDRYSHPVIECAPLHLCVIQLGQNEEINHIALGDSINWLVGQSLTGTKSQGSWSITVKPRTFDIATDLVITTNQRTYNLGLVSRRGATTHVVNFYYPEETRQRDHQKTVAKFFNPLKQSTVSHGPNINLSHINFAYQVSGDYPTWRPKRVFDDANKTFIEMPAISSKVDLPLLYVLKDGQKALINYRYKRPYYVIDGLFKKAWLISGKGHQQIRVELTNQKFKG